MRASSAGRKRVVTADSAKPRAYIIRRFLEKNPRSGPAASGV
jgi:hypothetical protein